jgi:hypothetical protein
MGVLVLVAVSALWMTQRTPQVAEIDDLNEWVRAHQETKSVQSQTWDDPWVAVASESTP